MGKCPLCTSIVSDNNQTLEKASVHGEVQGFKRTAKWCLIDPKNTQEKHPHPIFKCVSIEGSPVVFCKGK
jgi:hypothetical protein